jgi:hypothetical protein
MAGKGKKSGGSKKGGGGGFKLNAKVDKEAEIVQELQVKKKYLEEKFSKKK